MATNHPLTPDGRYLVVRERLWRAVNPHLPRRYAIGMSTH